MVKEGSEVLSAIRGAGRGRAREFPEPLPLDPGPEFLPHHLGLVACASSELRWCTPGEGREPSQTGLLAFEEIVRIRPIYVSCDTFNN